MIKRYNELGMPEENKQELSDAMYGMCDSLGLTDYNKSLTYDEIVQSWIDNVEKGGGFGTVVYDNIFRIIDTDRNGSISLKEWEIHFMAINIPAEHAEPSFKAIDTNGDGVISHDEFVAYHYEYFHTNEDKLHSSILYGPLPKNKALERQEF
ncbi:sarcoplasmic calcium-binding [Paramuricea clavata]|uniref:Sarcoplasmic calcium-binding n=1 Tax=Paramuricea clavata TaxID=317549 RepID=A0A7D9DNI9_PARCT|nr:sarcoplasmic calcium-binding [Paramuricea clavata]